MLPHIDVPVTELVRAEELLAPPPDPEPAMEKNLTEQIETAAQEENPFKMQLTHTSSRDPKLLLPELERRMGLLFAAYKAEYPDSPQPRISQTTRSASDQKKEYANGRTAPGPVTTHALAGQSLHNYQPALAFDVFFTVDGKYSTDESLYRNLGELAPSVGLEWGGTWPEPKTDTPHFQPPNYTWEMAAKNIKPTFPEV